MFILKLTAKLDKHHIRYALVGGYAVALHGAVRGTIDIDLVIRISMKEFKKTEQLLGQLGLQCRLPVTAEDVFNFREEYISNRNMLVWSFVNPDKASECVDILLTENLDDLKTVIKTVGSQKIRVASIPDLIRMKSDTGRKQDIEDIKALKELL